MVLPICIVALREWADIRSFAYNALGGSTAGASATDLPAGVRQEIFDSAGMQEIYGVNIVELLELGVGQKYNTSVRHSCW